MRNLRSSRGLDRGAPGRAGRHAVHSGPEDSRDRRATPASRYGPALLSAALVLVESAPRGRRLAAAGPDQPVAWPERAGAARVVVTTLATGGYFLGLESLGFPAASALFAGALCWYLGRAGGGSAVATSVAAGLLIQSVSSGSSGSGFPKGFAKLCASRRGAAWVATRSLRTARPVGPSDQGDADLSPWRYLPPSRVWEEEDRVAAPSR